MKCTVCHEDKELYHFYKGSTVCFDCDGPYECIVCGELKPASEFRIQGQVCRDCKQVNPKRWNRSIGRIILKQS